MTKPLTATEMQALDLLLAHHVGGAPADRRSLASALVVLAQRRPFLTIGRAYIAAAIAANLSHSPTERKAP